jgi:hypothetical protein
MRFRGLRFGNNPVSLLFASSFAVEVLTVVTVATDLGGCLVWLKRGEEKEKEMERGNEGRHVRLYALLDLNARLGVKAVFRSSSSSRFHPTIFYFHA